MSANVFVQTTPENQILDLASYISKLRGEEGKEEAYVKEIKALLASDKKSEVYTKLAKDSSVLLTENDKEVEGAFNLLVVITLSAPENNLAASVQALVDTLSKTESQKTSLKQKILLNLYNALPVTSALRYNAFVGLVDVTAQADELDSLYAQLEHIDRWVKQWGIDIETERNLYSNLSDKLRQAREEKLSLDFLLKKLSTYSQETVSTDCAKEAVTRAVDTENFFAFEDLLQYSAIQKIKGTPEYELLNVFLNGNLSTYKTFAASNPTLVKDSENNLRKMRLLSLASLGSDNLARELTYAEVAKALDISEDEVEMWVIDVIRAGLVEAKLDQLNKNVIVHRSIYRVFGKEQWQQLGARLNTWKDSLNEILAIISNAKLIAGGSQGGSAVVIEDKSVEVATKN
ncbi:hypothetical protein J3Q64DRAFT_1711151 [Phycomyces blakesleeanus]|uniref:Eukaryotic translation initiation factor 3 subunit M n=2 Tax=Phycomyces blakesleeanus TaxID=4837 RepID=A0A162ZRU9_PHYB8|nr:hypothetical protein PHYBLDRAFT_160087 [Phycomyces blakesleeanus NRRL 1555(-)]OAD68661.1 hypothetical protein PHYBLDRAFT_160087 [Phycomyces blakesleeanus NRRL 1555(-)]|eukprot:XP_018286701.1 hypothetical protein PHYBLDRAFT_160087 [Phycomyces blakesleeanus NRRL 1555(-)]